MSGQCSEIVLCANAKVNLTLDVVGTRADGYHLLDMVNCSVSLHDEITLRRAKGAGIAIRSNARYLPRGEKNLAHKAATAFAAQTGLALPGLEIGIRKRIPAQAGLGGGSADAAAVLVGLNELLCAGLDGAALCAIGETVGADVPFCLSGGFARVRGIGEAIEPIPCAAEFALVILMPQRGNSTREAFAAFDRGEPFTRPQTRKMLAALAAGSAAEAALYLKNAFSELQADAQTAALCGALLKNGALGASMTGSGAAVFGLFPDRLRAKKCRDRLLLRGLSAYLAVPAAQGVSVLRRR